MRYTVDASDRVVGLNDAFAGFAEANGAPTLPEACLGRSLYAFVDGPDVVAFQQDLLARIRRVGAIRDVPFRCDAPGLRRYMRLDAEAAADGSVAFASRMEREEPAPVLPAPPPHAAQPVLVVQCAWCNRYQMDDWVEVEEVYAWFHHHAEDRGVTVSHGICPTCTDSLLKDFQDDP